MNQKGQFHFLVKAFELLIKKQEKTQAIAIIFYFSKKGYIS